MSGNRDCILADGSCLSKVLRAIDRGMHVP